MVDVAPQGDIPPAALAAPSHQDDVDVVLLNGVQDRRGDFVSDSNGLADRDIGPLILCELQRRIKYGTFLRDELTALREGCLLWDCDDAHYFYFGIAVGCNVEGCLHQPIDSKQREKSVEEKAMVSAGPANPAAKPVRANTPAPIIAPTPIRDIEEAHVSRQFRLDLFGRDRCNRIPIGYRDD
ncbi:hypothetical protein C443_20822 [Haloarcula argentinensis DSM 12282]|nr:hypothetical protein C443_20822 [Haloarcula argentinensis DSM 12282]